MSKITAISQEILKISVAPAGSPEENNTLLQGVPSASQSNHIPEDLSSLGTSKEYQQLHIQTSLPKCPN